MSGALGDAAAGLKLAMGCEVGLSADDREFLLRRHHRPEPRVALGQALAASGAVTAMLDLSDGMASDLRHICRQSGVSAVIREAEIPVSPAFRRFCERTNPGTRRLSITGGEDYELLFTAAPGGNREVDALAAGSRIRHIGWIEAGDGRIHLEDAQGARTELKTRGFDHFTGPA